jgi:hypothetical protein
MRFFLLTEYEGFVKELYCVLKGLWGFYKELYDSIKELWGFSTSRKGFNPAEISAGGLFY